VILAVQHWNLLDWDPSRDRPADALSEESEPLTKRDTRQRKGLAGDKGTSAAKKGLVEPAESCVGGVTRRGTPEPTASNLGVVHDPSPWMFYAEEAWHMEKSAL